MKKLIFLLVLLLSFSLPKAQSGTPGTFEAGKNVFLLNGKPYTVRAAELHYARIPRPYWDHRIKLAKAMGMNTVCIYLFWNYHEQQQGVYDFKGQKDVAEFVRLIQKNGMNCIVRPGPYVCAEWDMGGLPWWLLKKKDLKVRTINDSLFMDRAKRFTMEVGKQLAPLQIQNGGPIIMVQVENEYGVWGNDQKYMEAIRDNIRAAGFDKVQLFRCDWSSNFYKYQLPGVASTLNFGAGSNIDGEFKRFKEINPDAPLMCSEYWTGWFDQWGRPHETRSVESFIGSLKDMMDRKVSFSLYMAHGGTSFGQWAGANAPAYAPTTSSYDYNAPIDEAGNTTEKFFAVRNLLKNYLQEGETLGEIPANPEKTIKIPAVKMTLAASLFNNLPKPNTCHDIVPMEFFNQGWGSIMYCRNIPASANRRTLTITEVHDWATVFVNGKSVGKLDRRRGDKQVVLPPMSKESRLDILVEGMGRVNYGQAILDRKGITSKVVLTDGTAETDLKDWQVFNFPVDYNFQAKAKFAAAPVTGPAWFKGTFHLTATGNTYFDMSKWGKGMVWINGFNLGRFWRIGPTQTLFVPGCLLKKGLNEIIVFDLDNPTDLRVAGIDHPILDVTAKDGSQLNRKPGQTLELSAWTPVLQDSLPAGAGWKTVSFGKTVSGRFFCLEVLSAQNANDPVTCIAEMELTGEDGKAVSTLKWKVLYADSEEINKANNTADKLYDLQESIPWQTEISNDKPKHPHQVVIDLGEVVKLTGMRLLPRSDKSTVGNVKDFRVYLENVTPKF